MKVAFTTGYRESFWGAWPWVRQMGGSELMVTELAKAMAADGHDVTVRLPYAWPGETVEWGVRWLPESAPSEHYDAVFSFDDFEVKDRGRAFLVACRSDPPQHTQFQEMIFLSANHAVDVGHPGALHIGGGVRLEDYEDEPPRIPRRVIYTSSPDRGGHHAEVIGRSFDFVATYRGAREVDRPELIRLQKQAQVLIHPYEAPRESEFFCMAALEAMAAGTPCVLADGAALVELWGDTALILARPIRYSRWIDEIEELLADRGRWRQMSEVSKRKAQGYSWRAQATRYLEVARR